MSALSGGQTVTDTLFLNELKQIHDDVINGLVTYMMCRFSRCLSVVMLLPCLMWKTVKTFYSFQVISSASVFYITSCASKRA